MTHLIVHGMQVIQSWDTISRMYLTTSAWWLKRMGWAMGTYLNWAQRNVSKPYCWWNQETRAFWTSATIVGKDTSIHFAERITVIDGKIAAYHISSKLSRVNMCSIVSFDSHKLEWISSIENRGVDWNTWKKNRECDRDKSVLNTHHADFRHLQRKWIITIIYKLEKLATVRWSTILHPHIRL